MLGPRRTPTTTPHTSRHDMLSNPAVSVVNPPRPSDCPFAVKKKLTAEEEEAEAKEREAKRYAKVGCHAKVNIRIK